MKKLAKIALFVLLAAFSAAFIACTPEEEKPGDPYALVTNAPESIDPEAALARKNSPLLGEWNATSTDKDTGLDTTTTLFTFHEDGTVTSVYPDTGANALGIYVKVVWNYDPETGALYISYTDVRGMEMTYTFDVTIAKENYIILRVVAPENAAGNKLSLTR